MYACKNQVSWLQTLVFTALIVSMTPHKMQAGITDHITKKKIAIVAAVAGTLFVISDNAKYFAKKAGYKAEIALLRLALKCPISDENRQKVSEKLDAIEALYTIRSGNGQQGEVFKLLIKDFKDLIDAAKNVEWLLKA